MQDSLSGLFKNRAGNGRLLAEFCKFLVEFVDTAGRVNKFHFAGKKRVAERRDLHFYERVFIAVFPGDGFFRVDAGFAQESIVGRDVFEYNRAVAGRVDIFFHDFIFSKIRCKPVFSKFEAQKYESATGITKHFLEKVYQNVSPLAKGTSVSGFLLPDQGLMDLPYLWDQQLPAVVDHHKISQFDLFFLGQLIAHS